MVLRCREDRGDVWCRCGGKACRKELLAKIWTWFQGSDLLANSLLAPQGPELPQRECDPGNKGCDQSMRTILLFIHAWAEKWTTAAFCSGTFDMNDAAGIRLKAAMRRVAEEWLLNNPVHVGGPGLMDELLDALLA
uniref:Post-SET domain-containing protein n=1 Tax=Trichuris muris TaxID=70415 RepID=A0A5S6QA99_TRIMR